MIAKPQTEPVIGAAYFEVLETGSPVHRDEDVVDVVRLIETPVVMVGRSRFRARTRHSEGGMHFGGRER